MYYSLNFVAGQFTVIVPQFLPRVELIKFSSFNKMVLKCSVKGCDVTQKSSRLYSCRRRNTELLPKWLAVIGRKDFIGKPEAEKFRVCSRHFSSDQKFAASPRNHTDLKYNAIPDINLPEEAIQVTPGTEVSFTTVVIDEDHPASRTLHNSYKKVRKTPEIVSSSSEKIFDCSTSKNEDHPASNQCNSFKKVCETAVQTTTRQSQENETNAQKLRKQEFIQSKLKLFSEHLDKIDDKVIRSSLYLQITMFVKEMASKDDDIKQLKRKLNQLEEQKLEKDLKNPKACKCQPDKICDTSERVFSNSRQNDVVNECSASQSTTIASSIIEDDIMLPALEIIKPIRRQNTPTFFSNKLTQCYIRSDYKNKGIQCNLTEKPHLSLENVAEIEWSANCFHFEHEPEIEIMESSSEYDVPGRSPTHSVPVTLIGYP